MEQRVRTYFELNPADKEQVPQSWKLLRVSVHERRRSVREQWYKDSTVADNPVRDEIAVMSRNQITKLIGEAADALAYTGEWE